jgi:hypothetical protein
VILVIPDEPKGLIASQSPHKKGEAVAGLPTARRKGKGSMRTLEPSSNAYADCALAV